MRSGHQAMNSLNASLNWLLAQNDLIKIGSQLKIGLPAEKCLSASRGSGATQPPIVQIGQFSDTTTNKCKLTNLSLDWPISS
jgi:hypothetical protein